MTLPVFQKQRINHTWFLFYLFFHFIELDGRTIVCLQFRAFSNVFCYSCYPHYFLQICLNLFILVFRPNMHSVSLFYFLHLNWGFHFFSLWTAHFLTFVRILISFTLFGDSFALSSPSIFLLRQRYHPQYVNSQSLIRWLLFLPVNLS